MSLQVIKSVNFGSRRGGLSTIGYTLYNSDGTVKQTRTTTNIFEIVTDKGIYACLMAFDDDWQGIILWDTGQATPLYAAENYNYLQYAGGAGGGFAIQGAFLTEAEKNELIKLLKEIREAIASLKKKTESYGSALGSLGANIKELKEVQKFEDIIKDVGLLNDLVKKNKTKDLEPLLAKVVGSLSKILKSLMTADAINDELQLLRETISNLNKEIAITVKIGSKLLPTKALEEILKEGGHNVPRITIK